jgi:hypothetical protein
MGRWLLSCEWSGRKSEKRMRKETRRISKGKGEGKKVGEMLLDDVRRGEELASSHQLI